MFLVLLSQTNFFVELANQFINLVSLLLDIRPVIRLIPLLLDFIVGLTLLFNPRVIFQIMDTAAIRIAKLEHVIGGLTMQITCKVGGGIRFGVLAIFLMHLMRRER